MDPPPAATATRSGDTDMFSQSDGSQLSFTPNSYFDTTIPDGLPQPTVIINELLSYVYFYRDCAAEVNLRKVVGHFYSSTEINYAKKLLVNTWKELLSDCPLKAERRNSTSRAAHDVETTDIIGILSFLDQQDKLRDVKFAAINFDRIPKYGPEELNICSIADKQAELSTAITSLSDRVNDCVPNEIHVTDSTQIAQSLNKLETSLNCTIEKAFDQLSTRVSTICTQLVDSTNVRQPQIVPGNSVTVPTMRQSSVGNNYDRTRNVVIFGVDDGVDQTTWRDVVSHAVNVAAGRDVLIDDALRLGRRSTNSKPRPILVKLHSTWDRRTIVSGSWKLASTTGFEHIFIAPDEPKDVRYRKILDRLIKKATEDGKEVHVQNGVVSIDGVNVFSLDNGFIHNNG